MKTLLLYLTTGNLALAKVYLTINKIECAMLGTSNDVSISDHDRGMRFTVWLMSGKTTGLNEGYRTKREALRDLTRLAQWTALGLPCYLESRSGKRTYLNSTWTIAETSVA